MGVARAVVGGIAAVAAAVPIVAPALARETERPRLAIDPRSVVYGESAGVDGRLVGGTADAGVAVALLERRLPGDGRYREIARARADETGAVRFSVTPVGNAYYAVRTRAEPVQTSLGLLVRVAPRIEWALAPAEPVRSEPATLAGTIAPASPGAEITFQRRGEHRWRTIATTTAVAPSPGTGEGDEREGSAFTVAVDLRKTGRYRVVMPATDALSRGVSDVQRVRVVRAPPATPTP